MKKLFALMLALVMLFTLAACGGQTAAPAETEAPAAAPEAPKAEAPAEKPVEMEVITVWSDNAHEKEIRDRQIAEFNEGVGKELGIQIEYTVYGDKFKDTVQMALQAGEAPDLFRSDSKVILDYIDSGFLVPIDDLPGSEDLLAKYADLVANRAHVFDGKTYTLPYNLTTYGFVINKDLFAECGLTEADYPTTWQEVVEAG